MYRRHGSTCIGRYRVFLTRDGLKLCTFKTSSTTTWICVMLSLSRTPSTRSRKSPRRVGSGRGRGSGKEGLCKACEIEDTKKFIKEKEKPVQEGKSVQGEDALSLGCVGGYLLELACSFDKHRKCQSDSESPRACVMIMGGICFHIILLLACLSRRLYITRIPLEAMHGGTCDSFINFIN